MSSKNHRKQGEAETQTPQDFLLDVKSLHDPSGVLSSWSRAT
jgi:hypothetical protein